MPIDLFQRLEPLPDDVVTQTTGMIGRRGSGKTYGAGKLAEEMLRIGAQVVVLDPVGNWYGLRLSASGKSPSGLQIPVLGGLHGDIPLNERAGELVADLIVDEKTSAILDVSGFSKAKRKQFVAQFAVRLFERKKASRSPLHLIIEEAHLFAPQMSRGSEVMLGAIEDIGRLGRNFGLGMTLIDQRPQSVNKEVLNQVECLIVFQLSGPHERKAIKEWIVHAGADVLDLVGELPSLAVGDCFVWSPQWLGLLERTRIKKKRTYDASGTPTVGQDLETVERNALDPVNLSRLEAAMEALVEKKDGGSRDAGATSQASSAAAEQRIQELEAELRRVSGTLAAATTSAGKQLGYVLERLDEARRETQQAIAAVARPNGELLPAPSNGSRPKAPPVLPPASTEGESLEISGLTGPERKVVRALVQYMQIGLPTPTADQVAILAGYAPGSGHVNNTFSALASRGLVTRDNGRVELARTVIVPPMPDLTLADLHQVVLSLRALGGPHRKVLEYLIRGERYLTIHADELAAATGFRPGTGHFNNTLSRLSTLGLIERSRGEVRPSKLLFPVGLR